MYEVPDPKKSIAQNQFPFKIGEKEFHLPRAKFMTGRQADSIEDSDGITEIFSKIADKRTADALLDLPMEHIEGLFEAWQKDSGVNLGESASSES